MAPVWTISNPTSAARQDRSAKTKTDTMATPRMTVRRTPPGKASTKEVIAT